MKNFMDFLGKQPPGRLIAMGFATVILLGALALMLPISVREGVEVHFIDALFTSTSAVCVTGLIAIDTADHFTAFGQGVVAALIQIGGLGVTSVGVGLIIAAGRRVSIRNRLLVKEALNVDSYGGIVRLVKAVLLMTLCFETVGAILSFIVFSQDYDPVHALGISVFHSIAAFNNSGFDMLGGLRNLIPYQTDVLLNMTTCFLIIFGGLGFLVILDILKTRNFHKLTLHSKAVITTTIGLLAVGTVLLKLTEDVTWMGAFFPQRVRQNGGIFHLHHRGLHQRGSVCALRADVHRCIPGIHRRRYQDQYLLRDPAGGAEHVHQALHRGVPPEYFPAERVQSLHHRRALHGGGVHRHLPDVRAGAGVHLHPAAV